MTRMGRTPPPARAATRAMALLAVLVGLLAMHGLASTHHAAAATAGPQHAAVQHHAVPAALQHDRHVALAQDAAAVGSAVPAVAAPASTECDDACADLTVLCVAVLAGAALLLLLLRRRAARPVGGHAHVRAAPRAPPLRPAQPPDPVTELCVSRT